MPGGDPSTGSSARHSRAGEGTRAMEHAFDRSYWDDHWQQVHAGSTARHDMPPNPF